MFLPLPLSGSFRSTAEGVVSALGSKKVKDGSERAITVHFPRVAATVRCLAARFRMNSDGFLRDFHVALRQETGDLSV
jgi:hypothetical protein